LGEPEQVGNPEAGEFFGITLSLFPSPLQVPFEKAAPAVLGADVRMARPVNCPGGIGGILQDDFVDHLYAPSARPIAGNSIRTAKFPVFPDPPKLAGGNAHSLRFGAGPLACRTAALDALTPAGPPGSQIR